MNVWLLKANNPSDFDEYDVSLLSTSKEIAWQRFEELLWARWTQANADTQEFYDNNFNQYKQAWVVHCYLERVYE